MTRASCSMLPSNLSFNILYMEFASGHDLHNSHRIVRHVESSVTFAAIPSEVIARKTVVAVELTYTARFGIFLSEYESLYLGYCCASSLDPQA